MAKRYHPRHVKESIRYDGKLISCTEASFVMLVDGTTLGGVRISEMDVRRATGEWPPDPNSPGLNLGQIDRVAGKLGIEYYVHTSPDFDEVIGDVRYGRFVQAQINWKALGTGGSDIAHSILVDQLVGTASVRINDPMHTAAETVSRAALRRAMEAFPLDGYHWGASRRVPKDGGYLT